MRNLRHSLLSFLLAAGAATAAACVTGADTGPTPDDSEAPLSNYDDLMEGAPSNASLPDDSKADAVYPAKFDLVAMQSPVKSQGSRGVCSIFSTVALMESLYMKAGVSMPDFSEQYLQWSVKFEVGAFTRTSGSNARENLQAISRFGIPAEAAWVYESFPWNASNDPECTGEESAMPTKCHTNGEPPESARDAEKFKLPAGRYLNSSRRSIKDHLTTKKTAVIVGMDFFYQSWNHRRSALPVNPEYWRKGYVTYPNAEDRAKSLEQRAGHSILIVGWDDDLEVQSRDKDGNLMVDADGNPVMEKGFFIFKNSWGTSGFGVDNPYGAGYGYLSMRYVEEEGSSYVSGVPTVTPPPPPPPPGADHFEAAPGAGIPDDDAAGVSSVIDVTSTGALTEVVVNVDIAHPYIGDLTVTLEHNGTVATLHAATGGSDDNIVKAYTLSSFAGVERGGAWTLKVVDGAAQDVGTLKSWSLDLR